MTVMTVIEMVNMTISTSTSTWDTIRGQLQHPNDQIKESSIPGLRCCSAAAMLRRCRIQTSSGCVHFNRETVKWICYIKEMMLMIVLPCLSLSEE